LVSQLCSIWRTPPAPRSFALAAVSAAFRARRGAGAPSVGFAPVPAEAFALSLSKGERSRAFAGWQAVLPSVRLFCPSPNHPTQVWFSHPPALGRCLRCEGTHAPPARPFLSF
jgi:hypothetical protein